MMTDTTSQVKPRFTPDMSVGDAMALHPDAAMVFSSYHLSGCAHCGINKMETIAQVCMGYGVPLDQLIDSLNNLLED